MKSLLSYSIEYEDVWLRGNAKCLNDNTEINLLSTITQYIYICGLQKYEILIQVLCYILINAEIKSCFCEKGFHLSADSDNIPCQTCSFTLQFKNVWRTPRGRAGLGDILHWKITSKEVEPIEQTVEEVAVHIADKVPLRQMSATFSLID